MLKFILIYFYEIFLYFIFSIYIYTYVYIFYILLNSAYKEYEKLFVILIVGLTFDHWS